MNEYYYLNAQNVPQGPHGLAELAGMMASGRVNPTTLIACRGGANWEPLGSVLSRENVETPEVVLCEGQVGNCPTCQRSLEQDVEGGQLPTRCPNCGRAFRPGQPGIWANFRLALSNYAKFSGRATRAEYWSFQLVNFLIVMGIYMVMVFVAIGAAVQGAATANLEEGALFGADPGTAFGIFMIVWMLVLFGWFFYTIIPNLSVTVRRLHDRGWSGLWLLGYFCLCCVFPALIIPLSAAGDSAGGEVIFILLGITYLLTYGFAIFLFVLMLLDSQRGANKYGPSSKYPLG